MIAGEVHADALGADTAHTTGTWPSMIGSTGEF
jgi:hypothetical protein